VFVSEAVRFMLIAENDDVIACKSTSVATLYWGHIHFIFTNYDHDYVENKYTVKILKTTNRKEFEIWQQHKHTLNMTINNTSDQEVCLLIKQDFSRSKGYDLHETVYLSAGDMKNIRQVREYSRFEFSRLNDITEKDRVSHNDDILFFR